MHVRDMTMRWLDLPLVAPIVTSYGQLERKVCLLVEVAIGEEVGHGECAAMTAPFYTEETVVTAWHIIAEFAAALIVGAEFDHPGELWRMLSPIRGNHMAKAAVEMAVWDAYGRLCQRSLADCLGAVRHEVELGVTCGLAATPEALLQSVDAAVAQGHRRVKLKIAPGWDVLPTAAVRRAYPQLALAVDANGAYGPDDFEVFKRLDRLSLAFIEQPFAARNSQLHAQLQRQLETPLCLDESICDAQDVELTAELQAARAINIKPARVGGLAASLRVLDACRRTGLAAWCGGMYETGFGRAASIAVAACSGVVWPSELAAATRHLAVDVVPGSAAVAQHGGWAIVPSAPGVGVELDTAAIERHTVRMWRAGGAGRGSDGMPSAVRD